MKTQSRRPFASESTGDGARMAGAARRPGCTTNAAPNSWEAKRSDMERDASMRSWHRMGTTQNKNRIKNPNTD